MTTCESVSAQWYRTWEKVEFVKLQQTYQWLTSDIYIFLFSRLDFETRTTKTWNQNLKLRGQNRRNRSLMCLHWAGESSLPVTSEQEEARWRRGLERFWVVLIASSRRRNWEEKVYSDHAWGLLMTGELQVCLGRAGSKGEAMGTSNASPGHSEKAQNPRAWKELVSY